MLLVPLLLVGLALQSPAGSVTLSAPQLVAEVDASKLKGELARLAWAPDGSQFYLQTIERDGLGNVKSAKHYVVSVAGRSVKSVDQEPAWASKYWSWKSSQVSPAAPAFKIAVVPRQETKRSTSAPTGGALAKGGGVDPLAGSTLADVASAAEQAQVLTIYTLKLGSETLGEWVNEPVMPGANFSWAPAPLHAIVFAKRDGGPLIVLDDSGHKQELTGAKAATLPAWSDDGKRLAWLERKDRKKYELMIAEVSAK
jgi:WD40 repeat protein